MISQMNWEPTLSLESLLYLSRSCINPNVAQATIEEIVSASVVNNSRLGLTGALLFTGTHFAQVIEGDHHTLTQLYGSIADDDRHDHLTLVDRSSVSERRFDQWSMAYSGPSQFVSRHVNRLLNAPSPSARKRAGEWLTDLMREFANY